VVHDYVVGEFGFFGNFRRAQPLSIQQNQNLCSSGEAAVDVADVFEVSVWVPSLLQGALPVEWDGVIIEKL
jgi:hypothetical protein